MPDLQDLLRLLHDCVPDEATRCKILIANPARLYNF
jgi:predicted TIM-barrel fold metal-dependent hydrolase